MSATAPPDELQAAALARGYFGIDVPFMRHIGLTPVSLAPGLARTRLPLRPELANSRGHGHGGAMMSALDFTLSTAARSHDPLGLGVITIEMNTHFLATATTDLLIEAR
ncbi:MAG: PaaI family thioesterase, partial [Ottowia sp.]|nr:PaaI family thioesterase [Ottowia sp.]